MAKEILLDHRTLTRAVNLIKPPADFLQSLLFSDHEPVATDTIELSYLIGDREAAPFVKKNGGSILVAGDDSTFATVQAPNIRISANLDPAKLIEERRPGDLVFVDGSDILDSAQRYIAQRQSRMKERIQHTIEVLVSQLMQGQIKYQVDGQDNFQITLPRAAGNVITLSGGAEWNGGTATAIHILEDIKTAKSIVAEAVGMGINYCILGTEASTYFTRNAEIRALLQTPGNVNVGSLDFTRQYEKSGALYLGTISGVQFWEYGRKINVNGVATDLIRPKYAEFVTTDASAERVIYYAAIPDIDAIEDGQFIGEIFSKTWKQPDPSVRKLLLHSRPLPWSRKADASVSMKVVSG